MNVTDYWLDHYTDPESGVCVLCGNSGRIDTRGTRSPKGFSVGGINPCICPNGQKVREHEQQASALH